MLVVFAVVYLGMILGGLPGLALDRTGIALLGAIALVAGGAVTTQAAWDAIDVPTIALLFGMMVVSSALHASGFHARVASRLAALDVRPPVLLLFLVFVAGLLSAVLTNDVVCLAMAPLLVDGCRRRGLAPIPFLIALACASNVGSVATLIGNPQNMLVGQRLGLDFARYLAWAGVPAFLGLLVVWGVVTWSVRGRWETAAGASATAAEPPFDALGTAKALVATAAVVVLFLATDWPREVVALGAAGVLLVSRRRRSRELLARVDGQLLVLFVGLFVVHRALGDSGLLERGFAAAREHGVDPARPSVLFASSVVLSNLVSNVPATMLLLPTAGSELSGTILAIASTLAGNLLVVGSIANIIVIDAAKDAGVPIGWRDHARVGVPVTLATLAVAAAWLALVAG